MAPSTYPEAKKLLHQHTISGYLQLCSFGKGLFDMKVIEDVLDYVEEYGVKNEDIVGGLRKAVAGDPPFPKAEPDSIGKQKDEGLPF